MQSPETYIKIAIDEQKLCIIHRDQTIKCYPVSTAKNGAGEQMGSECTPTGWHQIRAKIGHQQAINSVFIGRRPTGEIYNASLAKQFPNRDWILTRILWLGGLEPGINRYGCVDSTWRYIYIHGCPDELIRGLPESHGCVRMRNVDMIDLFDRVWSGMKIQIHK